MEIGSLVRLKSGGPVMTIESVADGGFGSSVTVLTVWFFHSSDTSARRDRFPKEALVEVSNG